MDTPRSFSRKAVAVGSAAALTVTLTGALSPVALAAAQVNRVAGSDRIDTALKIWDSQTGWGDTVILARADAYPDALGAAPLAKLLKAPVVLTQPGSLPASVKAKLSAKQIKKVIILGGTGAVSPAVETEVTGLGIKVERIAGVNRYQTSAKIAQQTIALSGGKALPLLVATGKNFPDALTAGAAAAHSGAGFLLADTPLPTETLSLIQAAPSVTAIGGPAVQSMVREGIKYTAVYGKDRYDTAAQIATKFFSSTKNAYIATGANFPDTLSASATAALSGAPILLTAPHELSATTKTWLSTHKGLSKATIIGGAGAVSTNAENKIKTTLTGSNPDTGAGGAGGGAAAPGGSSGGSTGGSSGGSSGTGGSSSNDSGSSSGDSTPGGSTENPTGQQVYVEAPKERNLITDKEKAEKAIRSFTPGQDGVISTHNTMVVNPKELKETPTAGGIISVLPTAEQQDGILQKILKVDENKDGSLKLTTRQATLPEAVGPTNGPVVLPVFLYDQKTTLTAESLQPIPLQEYAQKHHITMSSTPRVITDRASGITRTEVQTAGNLPQNCEDLRIAASNKIRGNSIAPKLYEEPLSKETITISRGDNGVIHTDSEYATAIELEGGTRLDVQGSTGLAAGACVNIVATDFAKGIDAYVKEFELGFGPTIQATLTAEANKKYRGDAEFSVLGNNKAKLMVGVNGAIPLSLSLKTIGHAQFDLSGRYGQDVTLNFKQIYGITYHDGKAEVLNYKESDLKHPTMNKSIETDAEFNIDFDFILSSEFKDVDGPGGNVDITAKAKIENYPSDSQRCGVSAKVVDYRVSKNMTSFAKLLGLHAIDDNPPANNTWDMYESGNLCPADVNNPYSSKDRSQLPLAWQSLEMFEANYIDRLWPSEQLKAIPDEIHPIKTPHLKVYPFRAEKSSGIEGDLKLGAATMTSSALKIYEDIFNAMGAKGWHKTPVTAANVNQFVQDYKQINNLDRFEKQYYYEAGAITLLDSWADLFTTDYQNNEYYKTKIIGTGEAVCALTPYVTTDGKICNSDVPAGDGNWIMDFTHLETGSLGIWDDFGAWNPDSNSSQKNFYSLKGNRRILSDGKYAKAGVELMVAAPKDSDELARLRTTGVGWMLRNAQIYGFVSKLDTSSPQPEPNIPGFSDDGTDGQPKPLTGQTGLAKCHFYTPSKPNQPEVTELTKLTLAQAQAKPYLVTRIYCDGSSGVDGEPGANISNIDGIGNFKNLTSLDLRYIDFKFLPNEIGNLEKLHELNVIGALDSLPRQIGRLQKLQTITLSANISKLPKEIGQLTQLRELDLAGSGPNDCHLVSLPHTIGNLKQLRVLRLRWNKLTKLPKEIGDLENLKILDLYYNRLENIPVEIGQLTKLERLDLGFNKLASIPSTIVKLRNLKFLDINDNPRFGYNSSHSEFHNLPKSLEINGGRNCNYKDAHCTTPAPIGNSSYTS